MSAGGQSVLDGEERGEKGVEGGRWKVESVHIRMRGSCDGRGSGKMIRSTWGA